MLRRANRSAVRFEAHVRPRMPAIMVDATQFEIALLNLVLNAGDATRDGGLIRIFCRRAQPPGE